MALGSTKSDDNEDEKLDWTKMSKTAYNSGYKEGMHEARQATFQDCFDSGYAMGIDIGMSLGFCQALQRISSNSEHILLSKEATDCIAAQKSSLLLTEPTAGACQICTNKSLLESNIVHAFNVQNECNVTLKQHLNDNYSIIIDELGIESPIKTI